MRRVVLGWMVLVAVLASPAPIAATESMSDCSCLAQASMAVIGADAPYKSEDEYVEELQRSLQASSAQRAEVMELSGMEPVSVHIGQHRCRRLPALSVATFGRYSAHNHVVIGCGVRVDFCWSMR